ncbi:TraR/DksA family transcriptional regulator [Nocardioides acrostichi]|uniref:Histone H1-like repetitive region-containing protein n=1 Tax=Nocardioides acrostichi TaxID=2784339 RepID=A0A930UTN8_9ACTN|nr:TraR/DksA C4-type zinc finger protein [Nocardioides acrostichi]MBF4160633.1 histone H1-like repetitive region-containing protein [Nocardioides acrostichi]
MVLGTGRALAVSAARRVLGTRSSDDRVEQAAKKAPAKKVTKKAPAKKAPAKKTAAKKAPAKKTAAKKAPAKKAAAKKAPAKKTAAKKTPATKAAATKAAATKQPEPITQHTSAASPHEATASAQRVPQAVKKATAPSTPAPVEDLVVKEGEDAWTPAELDEVLDELNEQRSHSVAILAEHENELSGLMRDSGDGAGQDQADLGASSFERDHEMSVLNNERDKLAQIDRALARIADGTYGQCENCGQPIGKLRLMAFPRATLCMTCKQHEERR